MIAGAANIQKLLRINCAAPIHIAAEQHISRSLADGLGSISPAVHQVVAGA